MRRPSRSPRPRAAAAASFLVPLAALLLLTSSGASAQQPAAAAGDSALPLAVVAVPFASASLNTMLLLSSGGQQLADTWAASPACPDAPTLYNSSPDQRGRRWGRMNATLADDASPAAATATCAFKDALGLPVFSWETAPRCLADPSVFAATSSDDRGRLWGQQFGLACAFKAADSDRPLFDFLTAPACVSLPEPVTAEADLSGRLWGWEAGRECAYKTADNVPIPLPTGVVALESVQPATAQDMVARGAVPTAPALTWRASAACAVEPAVSNSVMDGRARLWGWESNASCAFKDAAGLPVYSWRTAPRCLQEATDGAGGTVTSVDRDGKLWGWEAGQSCAFKDVQQRPLRTWATAPACPAAPTLDTAVPDAQGRLWGWLVDPSSSGSNPIAPANASAAESALVLALCGDACAFKDARGNAISFLPGGEPTPSSSAASAPSAKATGSGRAASVSVTHGNARRRSLISSRPHVDGVAPSAAAASATPDAPTTDRTDLRVRGLTTTGNHHHRTNTRAAAAAAAAFDAAASDSRRAEQAAAVQQAVSVSASRHVNRRSTSRRLLGDNSEGFPNCTVWPAPAGTVEDSFGRFWGDEAGASCLYRDASGQPAALWDVSPACAAEPTTASVQYTDAQGGSWGWESGRSCAFKPPASPSPSPSPSPSLAPSGDSAPAAAAASDSAWARAPACRGLPVPAAIKATDAGSGQSWGWEAGSSCAFKDAAGAALPPVEADPNDPWLSTPACPAALGLDNSKSDDKGRPWGWDASSGSSCAFKDAASRPLVPASISSAPLSAASDTAAAAASSASTMAAATDAAPASASTTSSSSATSSSSSSSSASTSASASASTSASASASTSASASASVKFPTGDVATASSCSGGPTMLTSQPDDAGYLWGWQDGGACVFRNSDGKPIYYAALITGDWSAQPGYVPKPSSQNVWFDAPRCSKPPTWEAKPDSEGRLWGFENGQGCVFRDARGYPLFASDLQNGNVAEYYNQGSKWDNAPACTDAPTWSTARADNYGRLWGWSSQLASSCAYKDGAGQSVYPPKA